jgi:hypothetical protein
MMRRASSLLIVVLGSLLWPLDDCAHPLPAADRPLRGPREFFVVAPDRFHPALATYIEYKQTVRPTRLISLERVLDSTRGVTDITAAGMAASAGMATETWLMAASR